MQKPEKHSHAKKASVILFLVFLVFTVLAKVCDVGPIGFGGAKVGFSHINAAFNRAFPYNSVCFTLSEYLGYACILVAAIYALMAELRAQGKGIIMISEEIPELLGMADRILIMKDGKINGEFTRDPALSEEDLIAKMV